MNTVDVRAIALQMFCYPNKPIRIFRPETLIASLNTKDWLVQPKWDGHRALPVCDKNGNVTVFSRHKGPLTLARDNFKWLSLLKLPRPWALDGELLRSGRLIIWDYSIMGGETQISLPYKDRLKVLTKLVNKRVIHSEYSVELIETRPAAEYKHYLLRRGDLELEGVVFKRAASTDLWGVHRTAEVSSQVKYRFK